MAIRWRRLTTAATAALAMTLVIGAQTMTNLTGLTPAASAADPVQVVSNDFEQDYSPLTARGPVTLELTDQAAVSGQSSLWVTGRTGNWNGPAFAGGGLLEPGTTYTMSASVRLDASVVGSSDMHFTIERTDADGATQYDWAGGAVAVTADGWAQIGGDYTLPEGSSAVTVYIEAADIGADHPSFLVDDFSVTGGQPPAADVTVVSELDFENGDYADWTQSGGPTLAIIASPAAGDDTQVLSIARAQDYEGIQSPTGIFEKGKTYTFTMKARLAEGTEGTREVRFVVTPAYDWVGNTTLSADEWTTVTGEWTAPTDLDAAAAGVYLGTAASSDAAPYTLYVDDITITTPTVTEEEPPGKVALETGFEDGLDGWVARAGAETTPIVSISTTDAHTGAQSACVTGRQSTGDGIGFDTTETLVAGTTYNLTAWARFAPDQQSDNLWLSIAKTVDGATTYGTVAQWTGVTNSGWSEVKATIPMGDYDSSMIYFETDYNGDNTSDFCVDDIAVAVPSTGIQEDLTPIKDTVTFPVGMAIDSRETTGAGSELLLKHFDQVTAENSMKPEGWYDATTHEFSMNPETKTVLDFSQANDLRVYGHNLVWHSQTPAWFFQNDAGEQLTDSAADQEYLKKRLHDHIFNVAKSLSDEYGPFGSDTNPLVSFDVVNEVIDDGASFADGLRRSQWYNILGEQFIDLAFQWADEAFNQQYAAPGADRPITLFINDYNTEVPAKADRLHALVERLLDRGVPVDGVGHQFHASLATPVSTFDEALTSFEDLPVVQAVTELDVTTSTPVTQAKLIEQGYYYRDAFRIFREHAEDMFSVTIWGLTDGRSWRASSGAPLVFDDDYQAKLAYYGIIDAELPALVQAANVFQADVETSLEGMDSDEWLKLPLHVVGEVAAFQTRWMPDHLSACIYVEDPTAGSDDSVTFQLGDTSYTIGRDGSADVPAVVQPVDGGYLVLAELPLTDAAEGDTVQFDVRIAGAADEVVGWNSPGQTGTLTLVEPVSYLEAPEAAEAPVIDGQNDDSAWADAVTVTTDKQVEGSDGATAKASVVWKDDILYVVMDVTDPTIDLSGSDPWIRDSVEIYIDRGNQKNGSYLDTDTQFRISADNQISYGTGDQDLQASLITSATHETDHGYMVEAAIELSGLGGADSFQGMDFQVNDATNGARTAIHNWADPTNAGYQSNAHWGVGRLVPASVVTPPAPGGDQTPTEDPTDPAPADDKPQANTGGTTSPSSPAGLVGLLAIALAGVGIAAGLKARRQASSR
ncbi:MAG: endo-1,4-beta-xylanase [Propionibacteriaceae bacterium]|nr:endo-1,4-beta-xylanase [Propionibacteriaceae bacterium]